MSSTFSSEESKKVSIFRDRIPIEKLTIDKILFKLAEEVQDRKQYEESRGRDPYIILIDSMYRKQLAIDCGVSDARVSQRLSELVKDGYLEAVARSVYRLNSDYIEV